MCAPRLTLASASLALLLALLAKLVALDYLMHPTFRVHTSGAVVVTGASSGIGEHAAAALHALPGSDFLVFAGVRKDSDAKRLEAKYPGMRTVRLDVTSATSIADAVQTVKGAGLPDRPRQQRRVQKDLPVELQSPEADRFTFAVNVFGLLDTTRAFLPLLRDTGDGARLINVGSLAGVVSSAGSATYSASKFAVEGANDALRYELQPFGISVSLLQPGYVQSRMGEKLHKDIEASEMVVDEKKASAYGVSMENYDLYRHVFEGFLPRTGGSAHRRTQRCLSRPQLGRSSMQ